MIMIQNLLRFEVLYQSRQYAFPLASFIFLLLGFTIAGAGQAPPQVDFNAAYQISNYTSLFSLGIVFIVMFFVVSGVLRDHRYQMTPLLFSTPVEKRHFFWSRFLGVFMFTTLAFCFFFIGFGMGISSSDLSPDRIAAFDIWRYLWPLLVIAVPNVFICCAFIFSVGLLSKNAIATYASAIFIYLLYFLTAFYSNSPLMASSIPASPESMKIAALLDPFSAATFFEHTQFWTPYDKSNQMLSFSGMYLWNRMLWVGIAFLILGITYRFFSFRKGIQRRRKKEKNGMAPVKLLPYAPIQGQYHRTSQWTAFWSLLRLDLKHIFVSLPFLVVLLCLIISTILELYSRIFGGGSYGDSWYPFTHLLLELVMQPVHMLSLILIVFYSGELIWKARNHKFDTILNTSPTLNWVFFLAKTVALALLPLLLIAVVIGICVVFQLLNGHTHVELWQYLSIFYFNGTPLIVYVIVAIFIQSVVNNKYLGMTFTGLVLLFLGTSLSRYLGIEHPMLRLGYMPYPVYTDMAGYSITITAFHHYALYWTAFSSILSIISFKLWKRDNSISKRFFKKMALKKWQSWEIRRGTAACIVFVLTAGTLFYRTNVKQPYRNSNDLMAHAEGYERNFKKYDSIPRLHYIAMKTKVDLYPSDEKYTMATKYTLVNKNDVPVTHLFLTERAVLTEVWVKGASLIEKDSVYGTYLFKFDSPIQPDETTQLEYIFTKASSPYKADRAIVANGSYIRHETFEPVLGYYSALELSDHHERKKRGLPVKELPSSGDTHLYEEEARFGKVEYETVISTDADQIALAPGNLVKQWQENGRNFFNYRFPKKNTPSLAYFSADYKVKRTSYKGISLEYYYHSGHEMNHFTIDASTKRTLDYCISNFGGYDFDHLRIAEVPGLFGYGGAAHPGLINMIEDNLYLIDIREKGTFDLVSKRTIHEVAHQWWGMILSPKNTNGATFIVEGLAKYTEGSVLENMYGKGALWQLNKEANRRYFGGRSFAAVKEPPLYLQDDETYLAYGKNSLVLLSIKDLIGEEALNKVLRALMIRYAKDTEFRAHTLAFLEELYKVTPVEYHDLIDDWMKRVVRYDLKIEDSSHRLLKNGSYEITLKVKAKRFILLDSGREKEIDIDEPLQIGFFMEHPKNMAKEGLPLYLKAHRIRNESTTLKITVDTLPTMISVDPFLTRMDRNYVDNLNILE